MDDTKKVEDQNLISVSSGPENISLNPAEQDKKAESAATGNEDFKFGEKAAEHSSEQRTIVKPAPAQPTTTVVPAAPAVKKIFPKVYGYKIPLSMHKNANSITHKAGRGNPKKGITWLNVFLERLLKMSTN